MRGSNKRGRLVKRPEKPVNTDELISDLLDTFQSLNDRQSHSLYMTLVSDKCTKLLKHLCPELSKFAIEDTSKEALLWSFISVPIVNPVIDSVIECLKSVVPCEFTHFKKEVLQFAQLINDNLALIEIAEAEAIKSLWTGRKLGHIEDVALPDLEVSP